MAFHVACPITCRRICYCSLGFPRPLATDKAKAAFLEDVVRVHGFLLDPTGIRARDEGKTVQVAVPRVAPPPPPPQLPVLPSAAVGAGGDSVAEDEAAAAASAQAKRSALQRKAAADMVAAEDFARRFESGYLSDTLRGPVGEEQAQSNVNIMCRICFCGENEGSDRARRMLPCKTCGKKYHRNCIKGWSQHRDLFNWSSWTCPLCRICEVCRRTGDPNKLMFCKRCDGAYHCYCQHPSHKNVTPGPYCCPKHTKCHSCGSKVPGNGLSVRWFLGYTCCDACGRLFSKGNYCPVCLKVYRDSESTPMVCCDVCQRWVHCHCDGISDQRYQQFQLDGNLQYKCATCRGECCQIKNNEDAVKELWRRKDIADRDLISSLRAVAGLPAQEEIYSVSPYSDDDDNGPQILKNEFARPLKLSLKGLVDKSPKKTKDSGKKSAHKISTKKKEYQDFLIGKTEANQSFLGHEGPHSFGSSLGYDQNVEMQSYKNAEPDAYYSPIAGSLSHTEEICSVNKPGVLKHRFVNEVMVSDEDRTSKVRIKGKSHGVDGGEDGGKTVKSKPVKGKKLVINFGARKINITNSPRSDASPCQREEDLVASNGGEDASQQRTNVMVDRHDNSANFGDAKDRSDSGHSKGSKVGGREGNFIKLGKVRSGASDLNPKLTRRGDRTDGSEPIPVEKTQVLPGKSVEGGKTAAEAASEVPTVRHEKVYTRKQSHSRSGIRTESNKEQAQTPVSHSSSKDTKPLLKFKLKKPNLDNQSSHQEEEKSYAKGQRSKRKRPSMEKTLFSDNDDRTQLVQDNLMDEIMDANWILKKLGKDAIGKRVEVQQLSDNSWHKGVVTDIIEGTSTLSVTLDDGKVKSLELGKQGVRFISQKQKRSKA